MKDQGFQPSTNRAVIAGLVLMICSGLVLFIYSSVRSLNAWDVLVTNFASVFLSIGAVTLVYDLFLKSRFAADLLDLVQLRQALVDAGLEEVTPETSLHWNDLLEGTSRFQFLLLDPSAWIERDWNIVLAEGRKREIRVNLYLPDPQSPVFDHLAGYLGPGQIRVSVDRREGSSTSRA
jgi:hypothetical protein